MKGSMQAILHYLVEHPLTGLTSAQAFELFGVTRLSARIHDLRNKGYQIDTLMLDGKTRFGETCRYAKYVYKGKESIVKEEKNG